MSGQNIVIFSTYAPFRPSIEDYIKFGIYAWFVEYKVTPVDVVDSAYLVSGFVTGHFLQTCHDLNTALGCSVVMWEEPTPNVTNWINKFTRITCNYKKSAYGGDPLYEKGPVGSACPVVDNGCRYAGLCLLQYEPACISNSAASSELPLSIF